MTVICPKGTDVSVTVGVAEARIVSAGKKTLVLEADAVRME